MAREVGRSDEGWPYGGESGTLWRDVQLLDLSDLQW